MSELFPAPEIVAEPDWLKQARRRNAPYAAINDNDFAPAVLDRRNLLKAHDAHELEIMQLRGQLRDAHQTIKDLSRYETA